MNSREKLRDMAYQFYRDAVPYHSGYSLEQLLIEFADFVAPYMERTRYESPYDDTSRSLLRSIASILEAEEGEEVTGTASNRMAEIRMDKGIIEKQKDVIKDLTSRLEEKTKENINCSWVSGGDRLLCIVHDKEDINDAENPEDAHHE